MSFALGVCGYHEMTVCGYIRNTRDTIKLPTDIPNDIITFIIKCYKNYFHAEYFELTEREFYKTYWIESGKLGSGGFAKIRMITRKSDKVKFLLSMNKKKGKTKQDIDTLHSEIDILSKLSHKNICVLQNWCDTKKRIYIVFEKYDAEDVIEMIVRRKQLNENDVLNIIKQIGEGLAYIHNNNIIHRNLKPNNLLYLRKKDLIKIVNFRDAADMNMNIHSTVSTSYGSSIYVAPEIINLKQYATKIDMWSLGVIIYILLCGFPPFYNLQCNQEKLFESIKICKYTFPSPYWDNISNDGKDLIKHLLQYDPNKRYSAIELLKHSWITSPHSSHHNDLGDIYIKQMEYYCSSRHFIESQFDQDASFDDDIQMFVNPQYAPK